MQTAKRRQHTIKFPFERTLHKQNRLSRCMCACAYTGRNIKISQQFIQVFKYLNNYDEVVIDSKIIASNELGLEMRCKDRRRQRTNKMNKCCTLSLCVVEWMACIGKGRANTFLYTCVCVLVCNTFVYAVMLFDHFQQFNILLHRDSTQSTHKKNNSSDQIWNKIMF